MALVGPRPEELAMVARYDQWQMRRLKAKPGITGFQQITNRGEPSLAERVERDLIYMKHQGLLFDCFILLRTVLVMLRGEGRS
jgi:lipopolysaccharide/colanic/teichoic acid biosynthesis glycosyltransferase